jgi:hypothetical protein
MQYTVTLSRPVIDENRSHGQSTKPVTVHPGGKTVYGLSAKGSLTVIYDHDPRAPHGAYVTIDGEIKERDIVRHPKKHKGIYYVYTQRDAVRDRKIAPCLTMKYQSDSSKYAYRINFPEGADILYTTDDPFIGGNGKNGVRLWIESDIEPQPSPCWYDYAFFRQSCGWKPLDGKR